eukprot:2398696-Amphidinium_carterae.1
MATLRSCTKFKPTAARFFESTPEEAIRAGNTNMGTKLWVLSQPPESLTQARYSKLILNILRSGLPSVECSNEVDTLYKAFFSRESATGSFASTPLGPGPTRALSTLSISQALEPHELHTEHLVAAIATLLGLETLTRASHIIESFEVKEDDVKCPEPL